ncbi:MAG: ABC transporter substrate-binding protein [Anaerolineae bacterium]|jgi:NitT/TauT family transport system substrate-binding protein|nr:ABC transporter substrate-binding protein [Anaerolineae bacterium]MBT6062548.1 ABC transporter substrate-binding protein [Anaerolineae bacterium]MBT6323830.1 ABC transporter substrate-binding protein [Anaerolineae bacterium]MBT6814557.1 ABC transporter substrate-binding protein [Anaerolineae bacterium]MBT7016241.1 ABC transporter substrate-binding protein [Anaerolineae bacterium]
MIKNNTQKLFYLFLICTLATFAGCTSSPSQPAADPVTVKLSWEDSVQFLGFYVAEDQGYYADENLDITLIPLAGTFEMDETPKMISSGEIDFGVGGTALVLAHQDLPLTIVAALYQFSPGALFTRAESGIQTPSDLAGHSVAIKSESWETLIDGLLEFSGLTPDQITKVEAGFDMTPFYEGEVDVWAGWITNEVVVARLRGLDIITLPLYEYGIKNNDNLIFTRQEMVRDHPDLVERFLRATLKGWEWAVENPAAAVDIFIEQFPDEAGSRDFHLGSFEASVPLIVPGGTLPGSLDCQAGQFREEMLDEAFCNHLILQRLRDGE